MIMFRRKNILDKFKYMFGYNSLILVVKDFRNMDKAFFNTSLSDVGRKNLIDFAKYTTMVQMFRNYMRGFIWTI